MNQYKTLLWLGWLLVLVMLLACEPPEDDNDRDPPPPEEEDAAVEETPDCQLTLGWDPWEPYHYLDPRGQVSGLDIELVEAAAEKIDCEIEYRQANFARLLSMVREGDVDIVPGATVSEARKEYAHFSEPYREEYVNLWVRAAEQADLKGRTLEDMLRAERRIGVTEGFVYGDEVEEVLNKEEYRDLIINARLTEINLMRLIDHDLGGFLADPFVINSIQRRLGIEGEISALGDPVRQGTVSLMFSLESVDSDIRERFDGALAELREDGTKERILERYTPAME